ncbi:MAG TPA: histidinol dehydrogenase [Vicinamibacterales bacterium]|nr:histidinol dehydrogenase [Vicinamibacterales bacterium]
MRIFEANDKRAIARLLTPSAQRDRAFERRVQTIVDRVRCDGDAALTSYVRRFDRVTGSIEVDAETMRAEADRVEPAVRRAIKQAARHIARVAFKQIPRHVDLDVVAGVSVEQRVEPLERVGCYVPGGRFPLPSSLLMTAVPARVAGVREVIVACPNPAPAVMAAALEARVTRLFCMGGAHAIAALAYGTRRVPRVDKIVGPGNRFVAAAKALVARDCAIDFHAGPTEIVVVAGAGQPAWIAADLIAQAEHDPDARCVFITWSRLLARRVAGEMAARSRGRDIVRRSLTANGAIVIARRPDEAMMLARRLAPEHLVVDREELIQHPITAGAVFVGPYSAQAAGDYATGSNHVLPTSGAARYRGGLSAADFVRVMSVQRLSADGLARLAPVILPLARAEGLEAHAESIEVRLR